MLPFCCHKGHKHGEKPLFTGFFTGVKSFPLNSCRGLGGDVIDDAVDVLDLVYYPHRAAFQNVIRYSCKIGGHKVCCCNRSKSKGIIIRSSVTHYSDRPHRSEHRKVLAYLPVKSALCKLVPEYPVGVLEYLKTLVCDLSDYSYGKSRSRERLAPYKLIRKSESSAERSYFILKKKPERLYDLLEINMVRQSAYIVVTLYNRCVACA